MNVPTLLVGLGGTGSKIVQMVCERATESQKKSLGFVIFDTDVNELSQIEENNPKIRTIQTSSRLTVGEYLEIDQDSRDTWFPVNDILNSKALTDGAGQVRAISRLALHTAVHQGRMEPLDEAMEDLYKLDGEQLQGNPRVILAGTLCGGTGAGLVLPVSMYIRNYMANRLQQASVSIRGFFLLPDVLDRVIDSESERNNLRCNAYAAVRELDAFLLKADGGLDKSYNLKLMLPRPGSTEKDDYTCRPLDFCFLFDEQNLDGKMLDSYKDYLDHAANCIYSMAVAPTSRRSSSSEDNVIREIIYAKGRNRYAGAGSSMLIYPTDDVKRYLALRWTKETVTDAWIKVDEDFEQERVRAKSKREGGLYVPEIDRGSHYLSAIRIGKKTRNQFASAIYDKCIQYDEDGLESSTNSADYISAVKKLIKDEIQNQRSQDKVADKLGSIRSASKNNESMGDPKSQKDNGSSAKLQNDIAGNYSKWYNHLKTYQGQTMRITAIVAENMGFTLFRDKTDFSMAQEPYRLEYWMHPAGDTQRFIHPNAVRYLLYDILEQMEEEAESNKLKVDRILKFWNSFEKNTFDLEETEDHQESEAEYYKAMHLKDEGIQKILNRGTILDARRDLNTAFNSHFENTEKYWEAFIFMKVFSDGVNYLKTLCDAFEKFYDVVGNRVKKLDRNIRDLEQKYKVENKAARRFVCADRRCLQALASEAVNKNNSMDLPDELSRRIYQRVHKYAVAEKKPGAEDYFLNTFKDTVVMHLEKSIMEQYRSLVDMDVLSALAKEAQYIEPEKEMSLEDEMRYVARAIETSETLAKPFIEAPRGKQARVNKACAYHPSLSDDDIPGRPEFVGKYLEDHGGVADESIEHNMILFYQGIYDLRASQLGKFAPPRESETSDPKAGSYYKAYHELISHIHPNSIKSSAITPHLDRWWHVIDKLPELDEETQKIEENRICRAFFWGILGRFIEYRRSKLDEIDYRLAGLTMEDAEKGVRNGSYRVDISRLSDPEFNDDLIVSNGTICDRLYEVLDAFMVYPFLVNRVLEEVEDEQKRELYFKIPVEDTQLFSALRRFHLPELGIRRKVTEEPSTEQPQENGKEKTNEKACYRSFLELPLLMKLSVPVQEYRETTIMRLLRVMLDEIYDYMSMFCQKKDLVPVYSELLLSQFKLFLNNIAEDETYGDEIYEDALFRNICKTVTAHFRSLNLRKLAECTEDMYEPLLK